MTSKGILEKLPADKLRAVYLAGLREFSAKPFSDAGTDAIAAEGGISKGLLFHYFGSKKEFYLYCLRRAMDTLTEPGEETEGDDFYSVLFNSMSAKFALCSAHMPETKMVNMASRDASGEIVAEKAELLGSYGRQIRLRSAAIMGRAVERLELKAEQRQLAQSGLLIYVSALINKYLLAYQERPEQFFADADRIKEEFRGYIDLMLKGIMEDKG